MGETRGMMRSCLLSLAVGLIALGCGDSDGGRLTGEVASGQSCVVCHLDQAMLKSLAVEAEAGHSDAGEG